MLMPNRSYTAGSQFRYGFNGKENDNDVKGTGNQQDYGMRIYDPRIGKFLSVDPLAREFASLSSFQFAMNTPIMAIDLDGAEAKVANQDIGKIVSFTNVITAWEIRNSFFNSLMRVTPKLEYEARLLLFAKIGITDPEIIKSYQVRMRTVVVREEEKMCNCSAGSEIERTYSKELVLEPTNSAGSELVEALLDILNVTSVASFAKGNNGSPVLFAKGSGAIVVGYIRKTAVLLYNIRRLSTVGVNNTLQGVYKLEDVMEAGMAFVGKNAKKIYTQGGRFEGWESADGLKRFRPAAFKKNQGKIQSNFEQRSSKDIDWDDANRPKSKDKKSNLHVDTDRSFDFQKERQPNTNN